jgi:hypothetical protein
VPLMLPQQSVRARIEATHEKCIGVRSNPTRDHGGVGDWNSIEFTYCGHSVSQIHNSG